MSKPLTPPDCDLRGLTFMPLDVVRLLDSDLFALTTGDEFKAAVALWCKSWNQVPAASLPNDERILARLAGVSVTEWRGLSEMALKGWVACDDGRLYHPVVAEKALEAWIERLKHRKRSEAGNATRWGREFDSASYDAAIAHAQAMLAELGRIDPEMPQGSEDDPARTGSRSLSDPTRTEKRSEGTGTGTGNPPHSPPKGEADLFGQTDDPPAPKPPDPVRTAFDLWNETAKRCGLPVAKVLDDARRKAIRKRLESGGLELWRKALAAVEASAFLLGQRPDRDGRAFRADLDFVCQARSFKRLIEGFYGTDAKPPPKAQPQPDPNDRWRARMREFVTNGYWNTNDWEARPGRPGCVVPPEVLAEFGFGPEERAVVPFPGRAA